MKADRRRLARLASKVLLVVCCAALLGGCMSTPDAGMIGVVRSGKSVWPWTWFNGHNIRGVIVPGSGNTWTGFGSTVHYYPSDTVQRTYTITTDASKGDVPGFDIVEVPTADGVQVGLNGTFYFTTAFNGTREGQRLVRDFDSRFGVRTFTTSVGGSELHAWDGTDGWASFIDQVIRPVINNDLRASMATVQCAQLVASCALVHQQQQQQASTGGAGNNNNASIQAIQNQINQNLQTDIKNVLGEDYFSHITFLLGKVTLPDAVQSQIDNAQAQYAAVAASAAKVQQARQDALANSIRENGYRSCPACAQIDVMRAIPSNITTFAPGAGFAVTR